MAQTTHIWTSWNFVELRGGLKIFENLPKKMILGSWNFVELRGASCKRTFPLIFHVLSLFCQIAAGFHGIHVRTGTFVDFPTFYLFLPDRSLIRWNPTWKQAFRVIFYDFHIFKRFRAHWKLIQFNRCKKGSSMILIFFLKQCLPNRSLIHKIVLDLWTKSTLRASSQQNLTRHTQ